MSPAGKQGNGPKPQMVKPKRNHKLLLWFLTYKVPADESLTEAWIESARLHCKMKPEVLSDFRTSKYARWWAAMNDKRARRLAWFKEHGQAPRDGWTPGIPAKAKAVAAMMRYRKTIAPLKSKVKKRPQAQSMKLENRLKAARRCRASHTKMAALNDVEARLVMKWKAEDGTLTLDDYAALKSGTLPDDQYSRNKASRVRAAARRERKYLQAEALARAIKPI